MLTIDYRKHICIVELNTPTIIHGVEVIFLDANHCPGACIILFRQKNGMSFLHTGDFRYHPRMLHYPALRSFVDHESTGNETHRLSGVYLDTTYLKSKFDFSPQETVIKHVVELVEKHYRTQRQMYIFGTYTIGKERVFMEVAKHFGKKMCVSKEKLRVLSCYGWDENNMVCTRYQSKIALPHLPASDCRITSRQILAIHGESVIRNS